MEKWETIQGIYIHIPFCLQKCLYCDFASFAGQREEIKKEYTDRLCQEILERQSELPIAEGATIYFGGGTPSVLPVPYIGRIVEALKKKGFWKNPKEATIEANPGTLNAEKLQELRALGFDRISMGVQSLHDNELRAMGRIHNAKEALDALKGAQQAGFRVNGDLIYGYPGQTRDSVKASVEGLVKAGLKHISVYGLTVEEGTPLAKKLENSSLVLPSEDTSIDMYENITSYLPTKGLGRYEISNYAAPGQESLHNIVYWHYLPYLGFGLGATGFDGEERLTNVHNMKEYLAGSAPEVEVLSLDTRISESIFMGLRLAEGIDLKELEKRYNFSFFDRFGRVLEENIKLGLMAQKGSMVRLTERGMEVGNLIFEKFL